MHGADDTDTTSPRNEMRISTTNPGILSNFGVEYPPLVIIDSVHGNDGCRLPRFPDTVWSPWGYFTRLPQLHPSPSGGKRCEHLTHLRGFRFALAANIPTVMSIRTSAGRPSCRSAAIPPALATSRVGNTAGFSSPVVPALANGPVRARSTLAVAAGIPPSQSACFYWNASARSRRGFGARP